MKITIDPELRTPVHQQIVDEVKRLVGSGGVQPGAPMASVRELSHTLGVEPATVARAYQELVRQGLLHTGGGRPPGGKRRARVRSPEARLSPGVWRSKIARALDRFFVEIATCELDEREINTAFQHRLAEFRSGRGARP